MKSFEMHRSDSLVRFLRIGSLALLLTPLVFWTELDFFYSSTKAFYFMGVSEILFVLWLWLIVRRPEFRPPWNRVAVAFFVYLGVLALVSGLGVDPLTSFWGSASRMDGLLVWLHLGATFTILISLFRTQEEWNNLFLTACLVGWIMIFLFFLHRLDPTVLIDSKDGSTTGNSTYFGAYLLFSLFFALVLFRTGPTRVLKRCGLVSAVAFALTIFFTNALAAKGALLGGVVLFGAVSLIVSPPSSPRKRQGGWLVIALLSLGLLFSAVSLFQAESVVHRRFVEASSGARMAVWSVAWDAFLDRPFFGWGPENFPLAFFANFNPCFGAAPCGGETWFDRAHSKPLDLLVDGGIVLFVAYVWLIFTAVTRAWKSSRVVGPLFLTFMAAYLVHNLVEFDVTIVSLAFVITLAYVARADSPSPRETARTIPRVVLAVVATALLPFVFSHSVVLPASTNQTGAVINARTMDERRPFYERMMNGSPIGQDFRRVILAGESVKLYYGLAAEQRTQILVSLRAEMDLAKRALEDTLTREPSNLRASTLLGILYQVESQDRDPLAIEKAETLLRQALLHHPQNQQAYWPVAAVLIQQGKTQEAYALLDRAIALNPSLLDAWYKKLVAMKLAESEEVFLEETKKFVVEHPELIRKVRPLSKVHAADSGWLYTLFY